MQALSAPVLDANEPAITRSALRWAVRELSDRGLYVAARWAAELLTSVPTPAPVDDSTEPASLGTAAPVSGLGASSLPAFFPETSTPNRSRARPSLPGQLPPNISISGAASSPNASASLAFSPPAMPPPTGRGQGAAAAAPPAPSWASSQPMPEHEHDVYALGRAYYDAKEHERAAKVLEKCRTPKARFLGLYAAYLAGEKRVQDEAGAALDKLRPRNDAIAGLLAQLQRTTDPFELYLKGILLERIGERMPAIQSLVESCSIFPYNWSAWLKIAALVERADELSEIEGFLPHSFMTRIFAIHAVLEIHSATEVLQRSIADLLALFPTSLHLKSQQALISYHLREFDEAEALFDSIFETDPYRTDDIDTYSNILYVMEKRAKLAALAQKYTSLDRHRPETCCLVGNYYSLRGEHEKAVMYFRRALRLDRGYLSAWTLMGHEFVEMKVTHAAVEAYRRAVDVNRKDYRAWYGLGQTYEILDMPYHALSYFQSATALRPYDSRMWSALGGCFQKLGMRGEALKAFKRALLSAETNELPLLWRAAELTDNPDEAAVYHRRAVDVGVKEDINLAEYAKAYLFLAEHELQKLTAGTEGDASLAERYLSKLINTTLAEADKAKALSERLRRYQI